MIHKKQAWLVKFDYILGGETFIIIHFVNINCIFEREDRKKKKSATPPMLHLIVIYSRTKPSNGRLNREIKEKRKLRVQVVYLNGGTNDFSLFGKTEITTGGEEGQWEDEDTKIPLRGNRR